MTTREQRPELPIRSEVRPGGRRPYAALLLVLPPLVAAAEIAARLALGLGNPPLMIPDPKIEYLYKPSMEYHRFGNRISINAYSMRSGAVTLRKSDPRELRVLVIGDSVVNGGELTDDSELATSLLQTRLSKALGRTVFVGNISAGSWGPPNELAYFQRFGWFDADAVVLVLNSQDYGDVPRVENEVGQVPDLPDRAPLLALQEAVSRYFLHRLLRADPANAVPSDDAVRQCLDAVREMVRSARAAGIGRFMIAYVMSRNEFADGEWPGHAAVAAVSRECGIEPLELRHAFADAMREGLQPYRDDVHLNPLGQAIVANTLFGPLLEALSAGHPGGDRP